MWEDFQRKRKSKFSYEKTRIDYNLIILFNSIPRPIVRKKSSIDFRRWKKKKYDIQSYKEIIAFLEGRRLDEISKAQEVAKRPYQKVLLTLGSAFMAQSPQHFFYGCSASSNKETAPQGAVSLFACN